MYTTKPVIIYEFTPMWACLSKNKISRDLYRNTDTLTRQSNQEFHVGGVKSISFIAWLFPHLVVNPKKLQPLRLRDAYISFVKISLLTVLREWNI